MLPISYSSHLISADSNLLSLQLKIEKLNEIIKNVTYSQTDLIVLMIQFEDIWFQLSISERSQLSQSGKLDEILRGVMVIHSRAIESDSWLDHFITFTEKLDLYDPLWIKSSQNLFVKSALDLTLTAKEVIDLTSIISNMLNLNSTKPHAEYVKSSAYELSKKEFFLDNLLDLSNLINNTNRLHEIVLCAFETVMPISISGDHIKSLMKILRKEEWSQEKMGDFILILTHYFKSDPFIVGEMFKIFIFKYRNSLINGEIQESLKGLVKIIDLIKILKLDSDFKLIFYKAEVKDAIIGLLLLTLYQARFSTEETNYFQICKDIVVDAGVDKSWNPLILQQTTRFLNFQLKPALNTLCFVDAFSDLCDLIDSNIEGVEKKLPLIVVSHLMVNPQQAYKIFQKAISELPQTAQNEKILKTAINHFLQSADYPTSWLINDVNMFAQEHKYIFLDAEISRTLLNRILSTKQISYCQFLKIKTYFLMVDHENSKNEGIRDCVISFLKHPLEVSSFPDFFTSVTVKNFNETDILKKYKGEFDSYKENLLNKFQISRDHLQEIEDVSNFNWIVAIVEQIYHGCVNKLWKKGFSSTEKVNNVKKIKSLHKQLLQMRLKFSPLKEELLICLNPIYERIQSQKLRLAAFKEMSKLENLKVNTENQKELICIKVKNELIVGKFEGERHTHYAKILGEIG